MFFPNAASVQNAVTGQGQDTTLEEDGITLFIALGNELEGIIEGPWIPFLPDQPFRDTEPSASLDGSELLLPRSFLLPD